MTRAGLASLLVAIVVMVALTGAAGGCWGSQGKCNPGDTRATNGNTEVCNDRGKWAPYVKPTVRPR